MKLLLHIFIQTLAVIVAGVVLSGGVHVPNVLTALVVAIVLGMVNVVLKPLAIIITLPINLLTLGLFTFVINALLVLFVSWLVPGFVVESFWYALLFSLIVSVCSAFLHFLAKDNQRNS